MVDADKIRRLSEVVQSIFPAEAHVVVVLEEPDGAPVFAGNLAREDAIGVLAHVLAIEELSGGDVPRCPNCGHSNGRLRRIDPEPS